MIHAARALQSPQGHGRPPLMIDQPNAGANSETAQTWKTIHTKHTPIHTNKANMEWWLRRPNDIRGPRGPKASRHLSYRWGKFPRKNLTQETCPERGSNPGPLRDKRACYHLLHSGGLYKYSQDINDYHFITYYFIYNFNVITQYNSKFTSMPSRGRNCNSLLP